MTSALHFVWGSSLFENLAQNSLGGLAQDSLGSSKNKIEQLILRNKRS